MEINHIIGYKVWFLNIIFNFFAITYGLKIGGEMGAIFGATMFSRVIYFFGVGWVLGRLSSSVKAMRYN